MKKRIFRGIVFAAIFLVLLGAVTRVLVIKFTDDNCQTYMAEELYELEENSVEVAIGGSSQAVFCVSGMEMYEEYGISCYSTGSPNQPILCSLAWLRELDRRQDLKVAALDISQLFEDCEEISYRQALDPMHLSANKVGIVRQHVREDEGADSLLSYLFPLVKYHSRWSEMTKEDFALETDNGMMFLGNRMSNKVYSFDDYDDLVLDEQLMQSRGELTVIDKQRAALVQYAQYCEDHGIELVLFKTPKEDWSTGKDETVQELADELGVPYVNYASREGCEQLGIDFYADFKDPQHLNARGAEKVSRQLGKYLVEHYALTDYRETAPKSEQEMKTYHAKKRKCYFLSNVDPVEYLNELQERYLSTGKYDLVCQLTDDSIQEGWTQELQDAFEACGFTTDLRTLDHEAYVGAVINGETQEWIGDSRKLVIEGQLGNGRLFRANSKANGHSTAELKLTVNGVRKEFSIKGLNILVYNHKTEHILDLPTLFLCVDGELRISRPD